ncbi:MAG: sigma-70 family RNA polymerase sigma factor [Oscillospiraceae bacterium]|nr:sigma-70 family RNA polymerase sigma factor [Oscillospiraceae bacterium]
MNLSPEQENALLTEFQPILMSVALRFCNRYSGAGRTLDVDDCLQECAIVFLRHIRMVADEEHICPLPFLDFQNALCKLVLGAMPCSVPRRTAGFRRMLTDFGESGSLDAMLEDGFDVTGGVPIDFSEVDERISFDRFLSEISEGDREIIDAMLRCGSVTGAGAELGVHKSTVSRTLARLKKKYLADCDNMNGGSAA